ncbi:hypothetical protein ID741_001500 [Enterococcus sp. AZ103]
MKNLIQQKWQTVSKDIAYELIILFVAHQFYQIISNLI